MARVTKSVTAKSRHKKVLKATKGHYGARSRLYKTAKQSNIKSLQYAFRDRKNNKRSIMMSLKDSKPGKPLLLYDEPIYLDNEIIWKTTSGNYSFNYKKNISFGYISSSFSNKELNNKKLYIEVAKEKHQAIIEIKPLKDKQRRLS